MQVSNCLLYADDTVIFLSDPDPNVINLKLSSDLQHLHDWLEAINHQYKENSIHAFSFSKEKLLHF